MSESGPARVALEVVREAGGSRFTQVVRLAGGAAGSRVEIAHDIEWRSPGTLLKAAFPLAAAHELASYDLGLGVVERGVNRPNLYEVPAQRWSDLTAPDRSFGVAVLNDSRYGWDHPDEGTLRLTLLHTPRVVRSWSWLDDQASQDLGRHRVVVALAGHAGDWRDGDVPFQADRLNQPLLAWQATPHPGRLGRAFSLLSLAAADGGVPPVAVRAVKRAEASGELIVRLQELAGRPHEGVRLRFARPAVAVREVNGAEEPLAEHGTGGALPAPPPPLAVADDAVVLGFAPFRPRTLAVTLAPPEVIVTPPRSHPLPLPYNRDGVGDRAAPRDGDLDGEGRTIAGDLLPEEWTSGGVSFAAGPRGAGRENIVACRGQRLALPPHGLDAVYLAAAAIGGDRSATFVAGDEPVTVTVHDWAEPVGQWDSRLVAGELHHDPARIAPAYLKTQPLAWVGTHRHGRLGETEPYVFTTFWRYRVPLPPGAASLTLPDDDRIVVLAATAVSGEGAPLRPGLPFLDGGDATLVHLSAPHRVFVDSVPVTLTSPNPGAVIRYTLDGSEPTPASPRYTERITLAGSAVVRARAFSPGRDDRFVLTAAFTQTSLRRAELSMPSGALGPGVRCDLFQGEWRSLPDFVRLTPVRRFSQPTIGLPEDLPETRFALVCSGYLRIPRDGVYTLGLRSDDGSRLLLGDRRVIDNDGTHDKRERRAEVALAAGLHAFRVEYFQWSYGADLELWLGGDARAYSQVTGELLLAPAR